MSSNTYHILTVVGARPQFIKAAAMSRAIGRSDRLVETIVHSGQHYDYNLSGGFFSELDIPAPKYNLDLGSMPHNKLMGRFMYAFDNILDTERPDLVLVFGDTNTTAAAAIAAAKRNVPLAHVEAGLREWDKSVPEEVNKLLTDSVSDLLFSPTQTGVDNLAGVGRTDGVFLTGDISLDLLHADTKYIDEDILRAKYSLTGAYAFMTCHREANVSSPDHLTAILLGVQAYEGQILFAVHPRTRNAIAEFDLSYLIPGHMTVIDPIGFWESQSLLKHADLAITDSGGIIKEAYYHKVAGIIIDTQTEWLETIAEGWNVIAGPDHQKIASLVNTHKGGERHTQALGDGGAGDRIVSHVINYLDGI